MGLLPWASDSAFAWDVNVDDLFDGTGDIQLPVSVPFELTGSSELMQGTLDAMVDRRLVVWEKHGVISRVDPPLHACDLIDYAETGAAYEVTNIKCGERGNRTDRRRAGQGGRGVRIAGSCTGRLGNSVILPRPPVQFC